MREWSRLPHKLQQRYQSYRPCENQPFLSLLTCLIGLANEDGRQKAGELAQVTRLVIDCCDIAHPRRSVLRIQTIFLYRSGSDFFHVDTASDPDPLCV